MSAPFRMVHSEIWHTEALSQRTFMTFAFSTMLLPSLYFSRSSTACSCSPKFDCVTHVHIVQGPGSSCSSTFARAQHSPCATGPHEKHDSSRPAALGVL